ncbi:hypothetical protein TorRG33x02_280430, partial [Trema orientale]
MKKLTKHPKPIKEKRSYRAKCTVINVECFRVFNQINQWRMKMKGGWREKEKGIVCLGYVEGCDSLYPLRVPLVGVSFR